MVSQAVMSRKHKVHGGQGLGDETLNFKCFQANKVLEHTNENIKQKQQLHVAKILLLELPCIYATIVNYSLSVNLLN